jgi:hypothetical protein
MFSRCYPDRGDGRVSEGCHYFRFDQESPAPGGYGAVFATMTDSS